MQLGLAGSRRSDLVADLDLVQAPELADLAGRDRRAGRGRPALEHADRGHPAFPARAAFPA